MKAYCAVLEFPIEKEMVCKASGNHPLCRKCRALPQDDGTGRASQETRQVEEVTRTKRRRRCECGRAFFPRSNRQGSCPRCRKQKEKEQNRTRCRRYYQKKILKKSQSHGLEAKFRNEIGVF